MMASTPQESPQKPPQLPRAVWTWWLILLILMVWNIVSFWPKPRPEVNIPYTTFLAQVGANNVARVRIVGDKIGGSFVKPLQWPQAESSAPTSPPFDDSGGTIQC
jgi:FtsH Extracellular